ncbi:MAG: hypothetical protein LBV50_09990 [Novosphingobium sp.]|nr:hypothetical protein [Novosphingobium sp.]
MADPEQIERPNELRERGGPAPGRTKTIAIAAGGAVLLSGAAFLAFTRQGTPTADAPVAAAAAATPAVDAAHNRQARAGESMRYISVDDGIASAEIPAEAQGSDGVFTLLHDGVPTRFSLGGATPHVDERTVDCRGAAPSYKVDKPDLFAYSCQMGDRIVYSITRYGRTYRVGESYATEIAEFAIDYPAAQRDFWNPVVARIGNSLKVGD